MTSDEVKDQIFTSYIHIRIGLAILAFIFPIGLYGIGLWYGIHPQDSMSAYYFAQMSDENMQYVFPMRAWFVGILWAIGAFLYLYRGFSVTENRFLNIAGAAAIVVALFPMGVPDDCKYCGSNALAWVHFVAAGTLFVCMSIVSWACTDETLVMLPNSERKQFRAVYSLLAAGMTLAPMVVYLVIWRGRENHPGLFWAELTGVVIFAMYWATKSFELDRLGTQQMKLSGNRRPGTDVPAEEPKTIVSKLNATADAARHRAGRMLEFN